MINKAIYESIMLNVYEAIDEAVGEKRELPPLAEICVQDIHESLIDALELPEDHHLLKPS
jgi:hypothetical protein